MHEWITMKTLAILAVLTALSFSAWAQKATVMLNNYDANKPIYYLNLGTLAPVNHGFYVQLLAGPPGSSLVPVVPTNGGDGVIPIAGVDGYFDAGVGVVPGVLPGAMAEFQLRAWQVNDMSFERTAVQWKQLTGYWNDAAEPPAPPRGEQLNIPNKIIVGSYSYIPEPSTIALSWFGTLALLLFRRK